jgi:hypothetical protein
VSVEPVDENGEAAVPHIKRRTHLVPTSQVQQRARMLPSQSTRQAKTEASDESERPARPDSAKGSGVEGASDCPRHFPDFVKPEVSDGRSWCPTS